MKLCDAHTCTGCGVCKAVCKKRAIEYKEDNLGFRFPQINDSLCVECGLCVQKCPELNPVQRTDKGDCYLSWAKDDIIHYESASGGISYVLAQYFIRNGGFAIGCVWDAEFNAVLEVIDNEKDLKRTIGSKYVQSYITDNTWTEISRRLKTGQKGIVFGLPCQVAAIKSFTSNNSNLVFCDLLCHGGASPKIHKEHIKSIIRKNKFKKITDVRFRGGDYNFYYTLWRNKQLKYIDGLYADAYYYSFLKHTIFRDSCYKCQYATSERVSDFTIGDYWGIDNSFLIGKKYLNGSNVVIIHTSKAKSIWKDTNIEIESYQRNLEEAIQGNDTLKEPTSIPEDRSNVLMKITSLGLEKALESDSEYNDKRIQSKLILRKIKIRNMLPKKLIKLIILIKKRIKL